LSGDPSQPSGPILVVAPHQDDAALSCAALLAATGPVDVLTVFTGLPEPPRTGWWDVECGFADSGESVPLRNDEERRALEPAVRRLELLGLLEAQHLDGERPESDRARLAEAVVGWVELEGPAATVAVPVGAGWRPGFVSAQLVRAGLARNPGARPSPAHLYVRDVVLDALAGRPARLLAYEELPYLWGGRGESEAQRVARARGLHATPHVVEVDRRAKAERIAVYASQIPHISPPTGRLDDPSVLPAEECYWQLGSSVVR
jgi:hypothetical protein